MVLPHVGTGFAPAGHWAALENRCLSLLGPLTSSWCQGSSMLPSVVRLSLERIEHPAQFWAGTTGPRSEKEDLNMVGMGGGQPGNTLESSPCAVC